MDCSAAESQADLNSCEPYKCGGQPRTICSFSDQNCPSVGDPYIENCYAINRYLSKMFAMEEISTAHGPCSPEGAEKYCASIQMMVDMGATFVARSAFSWGKETRLNPVASSTLDYSFQRRMRRFVCDVNSAYDCAGLRRPIIQAAVFEIITPDVDSVKIPQFVKDVFSDCPGFDATFYANITNFSFDRIAFDSSEVKKQPNLKETPDLSNIEAMMWYFYSAMQYINAGYTAIHFGQFFKVSKFDEGYENGHHLMKKIREYADCMGQPLLLNAQASYKYADTDSLLFDFNMVAARPREHPLRNDRNLCGNNAPAYIPPDFETSPCSTFEYHQAVIDPCHGFGGRYIDKDADRHEGGISPMGCPYETTPSSIYFDFNCAGYEPLINNYCCDQPTYDCGDGTTLAAAPQDLTYFYSDGGWLANLPEDCKIWWLEEYFCRVRDEFYGNNTFLQIPARLGLTLCDCKGNFLTGGTEEDNYWRLYDTSNINVLNAIKNVMEHVDKVEWDFSPGSCIGPFTLNQQCGIFDPCIAENPRQGHREYVAKVTNPACMSYYSWHVQRLSDGAWLPFQPGDEVRFTVEQSGWYKISIRHDNVLLTNGVEEPSFMEYLEANCCTPPGLPDPDCLGFGGPWKTISMDGQDALRPMGTFDDPSEEATTQNVGRAVKAFPNPFTNDINVVFDLPLASSVSFSVVNHLGQRVLYFQAGLLARGLHRQTLDLSKIPNGVFVINVEVDGFVLNPVKLIKVSPAP
ncbi:MAG: T9SS type A sorting domain-containing protein [Bacteroidota bacterium]